MHSEGILSGELKHGPLALVDENMPCVLVVLKDKTYEKCHNALQQVMRVKQAPFQHLNYSERVECLWYDLPEH